MYKLSDNSYPLDSINFLQSWHHRSFLFLWSTICASHWYLIIFYSMFFSIGITTLEILWFQSSLDAILTLVILLGLVSSVRLPRMPEITSVLLMVVYISVSGL